MALERIMDSEQRAIIAPFVIIVPHGPARREVQGQHAPLTTGTVEIAQGVNHAAEVHGTWSARAILVGKECADERPLRIGHISGILRCSAFVCHTQHGTTSALEYPNALTTVVIAALAEAWAAQSLPKSCPRCPSCATA